MGKKKHSIIRAFRGSKIVLGASLLSLLILAAGCSAGPQSKSAKASASPTPEVPTVSVQVVGKHSIASPLEQVGNVIADKQVTVVAKAGGDVLQVLKQRGDRVQSGDPIIKLDTTDTELQKQKTEASLAALKAQLVQTEQNNAINKQKLENSLTQAKQSETTLIQQYNKLHNQYNNGLATQEQLDQLHNQLLNAKANIQLVQQQLDTLNNTDSLASLKAQIDTTNISLEQINRQLADDVVTAPISGTLTTMPVVTGMTINSGFQVGTIEKLDPVKIDAQITPESLKWVQGKSSLDFYMPDGKKQTAKVTFLSPVMNISTHSYLLELSVPNADGSLKPGMRVQVQLTTPQDEMAVAVPPISIVREGDHAYVYVLSGDKVEKREVKLGRVSDQYQEVLSGVQIGEKVVIAGQNNLKNNEQVQVQ